MSAAVSEEPLGPKQFVTFRLGEGRFGVPLGDVQEIIRMPSVVRVPLAPTELLGIANLRGAILPVASLRRIFSLEDRTPDDSMRVVVVNRGMKMGILVDEMSSVLAADPSPIGGLTTQAGANGGGEFLGLGANQLFEEVLGTGDDRVLVFDPVRVLEGMFCRQGALDRSGDLGAGSGQDRLGEPAVHAVDEERQLVSFEVCKEEYAFPVERVREIVTLPPNVIEVPRSAPSMMGMMALRDAILPLVNLHRLLGLQDREREGGARVVVTAGDVGPVGVVVDAVREVLRLPETAFEPVPGLLGASSKELSAICRPKGGDRVVTLLEMDELLDFSALREAVDRALQEEDMRQETDTGVANQLRSGGGQEPSVEQDELFVIFRLRSEALGIPVEAVREIVRVPETMTAVPKAPAFVEGIINLRGEVLPVIDERRRLGLEPLPRNERQRIIVLEVAARRMGFIVDSVVEVRRIPRDAIGPAPSIGTAGQEIVRRVASLGEGRGMVLLVEPHTMMASGEDALVAAERSE